MQVQGRELTVETAFVALSLLGMLRKSIFGCNPLSLGSVDRLTQMILLLFSEGPLSKYVRGDHCLIRTWGLTALLSCRLSL